MVVTDTETQKNTTEDSAGFEFSTLGVTAGVDYRFMEGLVLGAGRQGVSALGEQRPGDLVARLVEAVLADQGSVLPVGRLLEGHYAIEDVCLSIPTIVGSSGVREALLPRLSDEELAGLQHSADVLKKSLQELDL